MKIFTPFVGLTFAGVITHPKEIQALEIPKGVNFSEGFRLLKKAVMEEERESGVFLIIEDGNKLVWSSAVQGTEGSVEISPYALAQQTEGRGVKKTGDRFFIFDIHTHNVNLPVIRHPKYPNGRVFSAPPSEPDIALAFDHTDKNSDFVMGNPFSPKERRFYRVNSTLVADGGGIWFVKRLPERKEMKMREMPKVDRELFSKWYGHHFYETTTTESAREQDLRKTLQSQMYRDLQEMYRKLGVSVEYKLWSDINEQTFLSFK